MDVLVRLITVAVISIFVAIWRITKKPRRVRRFKKTADKLGLVADQLSMRGEIEPGFNTVVEVRSQSTGQGVSKLITVVTVTGAALPQTLSVATEGFFSRNFSQDIEIGDKAVDDALRISGDEAEALAILGPDAREQIMKSVKKDASFIEKGAATVVAGKLLLGADLEAHIAKAMAFALSLRLDHETVPQRLARHVAEDPIAAARFRNLTVLAGRFPADPVTGAAAAGALNDGDPAIRGEAAMILADFDALADVVQGSGDAASRARALHRLAGARGADPRFEPLLSTLEPSGSGAFDVALTQALAARPQGNSEAVLLGMLGAKDTTTQVAAAQALGHVGGLGAVEGLYPLAQKTLGGDLKAAAKAAIAQIQARSGGGARGGLAIAEGLAGEGALSEVAE